MISSPVNRSTGELAWALSNMSQAPTPKSPCTLRKCCQRWLITAIGIQDWGCGNNPQGHMAWLKHISKLFVLDENTKEKLQMGVPFHTQYVSGCFWIPLCLYTFTVHQGHNLNRPRFAHGGIIERQRHFRYWTRTQEWGAKIVGATMPWGKYIISTSAMLYFVLDHMDIHGPCTYSSWQAHFLPIKRRGDW